MKLNFILIICLIIISSCKKEQENNIEYRFSPIVSFQDSIISNKNEESMINIYFQCNNGCGEFGYINEFIEGNKRTIKIFAKYPTNFGIACTLNLPILKLTYKTKFSQSGTYYLNFISSDSKILTDTLIIN